MAKPGDKITVKIGGKEYETLIDEHGLQRLPVNSLYRAMIQECGLDLNKLAQAYHKGMFSKEEYLEFYLNIGYSLSGFEELDAFEDIEIESVPAEEL